jgi:AcrR family transcriptional regulator
VAKASGTSEPLARRRRSGELSELILDAARELFASKGYAGTSSREIAERAGVYEPSIYRRFGSKAKLFEAAVVAPFNDAISTYLEAWEGQVDEPKTTEELVRQFIEPLYELLAEHRELLLALISAREFHGDLLDEAAGSWSLDAVLQRMEPQAQVETLRRALSADPRLTVRVAAGLVMGVALLDPLLLADGADRPTNDEILEEMVRLVTYGVETRPEAGSPQRSPSPKRKAAPVSPELAQVLDRLADAERRAVRAELELERLHKELDAASGNGDTVHALDDTAKRRGTRRQAPRRTAGA